MAFSQPVHILWLWSCWDRTHSQGLQLLAQLKNVLHKVAALTHPSHLLLQPYLATLLPAFCLSPSNAWAPRNPGPRGRGHVLTVELGFWSTPSGARENLSSAFLLPKPLPLQAACLQTIVLEWADAPKILIRTALGSPTLIMKGLKQPNFPL